MDGVHLIKVVRNITSKGTATEDEWGSSDQGSQICISPLKEQQQRIDGVHLIKLDRNIIFKGTATEDF
jgi:hypothetical protein